MPSSIEHLPTEVWFMIFSFLEGQDLHRAFSQLNSFITNLLHSTYLRVYFNIKTGGSKVLNLSTFPFAYQAVEALYANTNSTSDLLIFLSSVLTFSNLRSLSLHIRRPKKYHLLVSMLPRLTSLRHLVVSYGGMNVADNAVQSFYSTILKLPQLTKFELRLSPNADTSPVVLPVLQINDSLRYLRINGWIQSAFLCHLVRFMPSLRFLNIYLYHHNVSSWNDLSLPRLTKTACISLIRQHIDLEQLTRTALNLKYSDIRIEPYPGLYTRDFFNANGLNSSEIDHVHIQMIWKKQAHSNRFDLITPVTVQGRKIFKDKQDIAWNLQEYDIITEYTNVV